MPQLVHELDTFGLWHFENNCDSVVLPNGYLITRGYNAPFNSGIKKFGSYSLQFNTSGTYASFYLVGYYPSIDIDIVKRFHIDFWVKFSSISNGVTYHVLDNYYDEKYIRLTCVGTGDSVGKLVWELINTNGNSYSSTGYSVSVSGDFYHVAIERSSNTEVKIYNNGTLSETLTVNGSYSFTDINYGLWLGYHGINSAQMYIDELRISTNCKYSGNFTPPTAAYET